MMLGFWKLKVAAGIENTRKPPIWQCLTNPVWTFLLSGSPTSAMMSLILREDPYDLTDSSWVSIRF
jgi:hypothetical protein